ncbi:MAG TPA: hypothetical protein VKR06_07960, partial [Ktedonosporobacter sp.]|nr:hypothetical protein [Ktedonosporobacter sp.]
LIYERDGVIFWIVGDLRDGVDGPALLKIASSLSVYNPNLEWRMSRNYAVWQSDEPSMLFGPIIYVDNPNYPDGPTLKVIGPDDLASTNNKHLQAQSHSFS